MQECKSSRNAAPPPTAPVNDIIIERGEYMSDSENVEYLKVNGELIRDREDEGLY